MAERDLVSKEKAGDGERSSADIRQNIAAGKENISQKVDQIGERIKEKLDWREYVKDSPYMALGVAAGLGYLGAKVLMPRSTPMERFLDAMGGDLRGSLGGLNADPPGLIKLTLLGIATKVAAGWAKSAAAGEVGGGSAGTRHQGSAKSSCGCKKHK